MIPSRSLRSAKTASAALQQRVRRPNLLNKLTTAEELPENDGKKLISLLAQTASESSRVQPAALADHVENNNLQADPATKLQFNLFVGASTGPEVEDRWAKLDMIRFRAPHQVGKEVAKGINSGRIDFAGEIVYLLTKDLAPLADLSFVKTSTCLCSLRILHTDVCLFFSYVFSAALTTARSKDYALNKKHGEPKKHLDWAIVEATAITEDGKIVPGASVGATPEILQSAEKIIIEVNTKIPSFEGEALSLFKQKLSLIELITSPSQRIGETAIQIDLDRVVAVIEADRPDNTGGNAPETEDSKAIARHLIEFLQSEVTDGRLPKNLLPLQSGIGNVANSIIGGLADGPFEDVQVWTEVLQDTFIRFLDSGKLSFATATSIRFSPEGFDHFYKNWASYKDRLLLRSQQVANSPEIIRRLGVIAMMDGIDLETWCQVQFLSVESPLQSTDADLARSGRQVLGSA
ncbi:hypothetical protein P7C70_g1127, partial [Phenoliferia sp. Uapishka_3]